jgi:hypothetical protein
MLPVAGRSKSPYPVRSNWGRIMSRQTLLVVLCVAAVGLIGLVTAGCGGLYLLTRGGPAPAGGGEVVAPAGPKLLMRADFEAKVLGKTADEVLAAVGRPDSTQEGTGRSPVWYYKNRTVDPVTGKTDWMIQVVFADGRVDRVNH